MHDDPLDDLFNATPGAPRPAPRLPAGFTPAVERVFAEACRKCGGSGRFRHLGPCYACKGAGRLTFKTAPEARAAGRERAAAKRIERAHELARERDAWKAAHASELEWLIATARRNDQRGGSFTFPAAMIEALSRFGSLTDNQLAAVRKLMARDAERAEARKAAAAAAPAVDVARIEAAFAKARAAAAADRDGVRWLKLRLDTFVFADAPARDPWPAAIFIKEGTVKLGRITGGRLLRSRDCDDATAARILAAIADPAAAAIAYGLRFKNCACCGRELTNAESRARGIGPICFERWF